MRVPSGWVLLGPDGACRTTRPRSVHDSRESATA
jgi:hypothetical protein